MKLVKQNYPFGNTSLMNWFFDDVLTQKAFNDSTHKASHSHGFSMPRTNTVQEEDKFILEIAAPGLNKEDFKIDLTNNSLTISTEKTSEKGTDEKNYKSREFNYTSFQKTFTVPKHIDVKKISAEYTNGVLNVTLPINKEAKKALQITVK